MSDYTRETVPTISSKPTVFDMLYRHFGKVGNTPILFLRYSNSNMDAWDPIMTNSLANDYELILFDNAGVADSGGHTPSTVIGMTEHCFAFCRALGCGERGGHPGPSTMRT
jgi:hypothetical protein